ncbi:MAG: NAD(P)/FAD-dependent oxidoreductase [Pseudomonadota bacterium]
MATVALEELDKEAVKKKYAEERAKRLRPEGNDQYQRLEGAFGDMGADPHTPFQERDPVRDHVTFAFIGAGLSGLAVGARLKEAGIDDFRLIEKAGGVGGTWYWNRYPGVRCDTAAMIYLPLLEETGYMPSEKYVRGPEILAHCNRIADQYGLKDKALFQTIVSGVAWQEDRKVWRITTNRGDDFTAKYVAMATGLLHIAKLPGVPGIASFNGKSFHTSRWDYEYTGGDKEGAPMDKLADKRVAVIGTGATGVQCIPHLAKSAKELFVFQRTPSSVDTRENHPIDPGWFKDLATPGWQKRWMDNFVDNMGRGVPTEDLIDDGWTEIARRVREKVFSLPPDKMNPEGMREAFENADLEKMNEIRTRVDHVVSDDTTAQGLKAWYSQLCKRPCFSDEYLPAYNRPNTTLVNTDGLGVSEVTETGLVVNGQRYEVDCIIYASGFEYGASLEFKSGYDVTGRDGQILSEYWADGMRTLHGLHIHGFPNAFMVQMNQGANMISNIPHNIVDHAKTLAQVVAHAEENGFATIEPTEDAVNAWVTTILSTQAGVLASTECTPGFWNNEGQGWDMKFRQSQGHPGGAEGFFQHMEEWRNSGAYEGLEFTRQGC